MNKEIDRRNFLRLVGAMGVGTLELTACNNSAIDLPPDGDYSQAIITNKNVTSFLTNVWDKAKELAISSPYKSSYDGNSSYTFINKEKNTILSISKQNKTVDTLSFSFNEKGIRYQYRYSYSEKLNSWNIDITYFSVNEKDQNTYQTQSYLVGFNKLRENTFGFIKEKTIKQLMQYSINA